MSTSTALIPVEGRSRLWTQSAMLAASTGALITTTRHKLGLARDESGQGTVEYVALAMLVAGLLAAVVAYASTQGGSKGVGGALVEKIKGAITTAGNKPK